MVGVKSSFKRNLVAAGAAMAVLSGLQVVDAPPAVADSLGEFMGGFFGGFVGGMMGGGGYRSPRGYYGGGGRHHVGGGAGAAATPSQAELEQRPRLAGAADYVGAIRGAQEHRAGCRARRGRRNR